MKHFWRLSLFLLFATATTSGHGLPVAARLEKQDEDNEEISHRHLTPGDFDGLNDIFNKVVIQLPDARISTGTLIVNVSNLRCTNIQVGDIVVSHRRESDSKVVFNVQILDLGLACFLDYEFSTILFRGRGSADLYSFNNKASIVTAFSSPANGGRPPSSAAVESCNTVLNIDNMDFRGDLFAFLLNSIEGILRNFVAAQAEEAICKELDSLRTTFEGLLEQAQKILAMYPSNILIDPLSRENTLDVPDNTNLLDFKESETALVTYLRSALDEVVSYLGADVSDSLGPTETGIDMNMNVINRKYLLENRSLTLTLADLPFGGGEVYHGQDKLTKTTITINNIKLLGLDTLTNFAPLIAIGKSTLQTELSWEYLTFEFNVTIDIKPSTLDDSFISEPSAQHVVETVKIKFEVDNPQAVVSLLLAVNEDAVEAMHIGSLLEIENILPCILSTIVDASITGLSIDFTNMEPPTLEDFVSPGIDRVVSNSVQAAFFMYKASLLEAVPGFFQTTVLDIFNREVIDKYRSEASNSECPSATIPSKEGNGDGFIDFRDLLLRPERYGDLLPTIVPMIEDKFLSSDGESSPEINSIIRPLTKSQSGVQGALFFPADLFSIEIKNITDVPWTYLYEKAKFEASGILVGNLDTLTPPLFLLEAIDSNIVANRVNFDSVQISTTVMVSLVSANALPDVRNELEVSLLVPSSSFMFNMFASIDEKRLLEFPIKDISNRHCWLATMKTRSDQVLDRFSLSSFVGTLSDLSFNVGCISCTSPGAEALPLILDVLEQAGVGSLFRLRVERLIEESMQDYWDQLQIDDLLDEATKLCPHSSEYDKTVVARGNEWFTVPNFSRDSIETFIAVGVLAVEASMIVAAKSHLLRASSRPPTHPLSSQLSFVSSPNVRIIDWTDLNGSMGNVGNWTRLALVEAQNYFGAVNEDYLSPDRQDIGANIFMRNYVLDDDRMLVLTFPAVDFEQFGFKLALDRIEIRGLDSLSEIDIFDAIAPQTIQQKFKFEKINIMAFLDFESITPENEVSENASEPLIVSFGINDIDVRVASLLAIDLDRLGDISLGAVLNIDQILPCFLSGFHDAYLPQILMNIGSMEALTIEGIFSSELQDTVSSVVQEVVDAFCANVTGALPELIDTTVRDMLNDMLYNYREVESGSCRSLFSSTGFIDFRDLFLSESMSIDLGGTGKMPYGDLFPTLFDTVQDNSLVANGTLINNWIKAWTNRQSNITGVVEYSKVAFATNSSLELGGLQAHLELQVSDVCVNNLDSIGDPLKLFQATDEASILHNVLSLGTGPVPLQVSARILFTLYDNADLHLRNEVDVNLSLKSISIVLDTLWKISDQSFFTFPLRDITNLNCWLATTFPRNLLNVSGIELDHLRASIESLAVALGGLDINISCVSCSSPQFDDLIFHLYGKDLLDLSQLIGKAEQFLRSKFFQGLINLYLDDAVKKCPHYPNYDPNTTTGEFWTRPSTYLGYEQQGRRYNQAVRFNVANTIIAVFLFLVVLVGKRISRRRTHIWIESLPRKDALLIHHLQDKEREREKSINETTESMFCSPHIPRHYRLLVPAVIVCNIGLYMGAHLGIISAVNLEAQIAGEAVTIDRFFEVSFIKSLASAYGNGGGELSVLLFVFSGLWPYAKLITTLIFWFLPPKKLSVSHRGTIFNWIDVLVKLSIIDIFMVLLAIAAFLVYVGGPDEALAKQGEFYSLKFVVMPRGGFYCLIIAQRISRSSSRFFLDYHRKIVAIASAAYERRQSIDHNMNNALAGENSVADSQSGMNSSAPSRKNDNEDMHDDSEQEQFNEEHSISCYDEEEPALEYQDGQGYFAGVSSCGHCLGGTTGMIFTGCTVLTLITIAIILAPAISIDTKNIWAITIESRKKFEQVVEEYSVFRMVSVILLKARFALDTTGDYVGLGFLLVLIVVTSTVLPLINAYSAIRRWINKRKKRMQGDLPIIMEKPPAFINRVNAWKDLEVYIVAFVIAIWHLGAFSVYAIQYYCDILENLYTTLVYVGLVDETYPQCYDTQISLPSNVLVVGSSFFLLLIFFLILAVGQYRRNKSHALKLTEDLTLFSSDMSTACSSVYDSLHSID